MTAAGWQYPPKLALACLPTPLMPLQRLATRLGLSQRLWVKRDDLTGSVLSGNKVRKLEFTLAHALQQGADAIVTCGGVQSNHCRATALLGAQLGLPVHLVLRGSPAELASLNGNFLLDRLCGATVEVHAPPVYGRDFDVLVSAAMQRLREAGKTPYFITTGASDAVGVWGYVDACRELAQDFLMHGVNAPVIVCASGSGGTQAGLVAGNVLHGLQARVFGVNVCDDATWFERKIKTDLHAWNALFSLGFPVETWAVDVIDGYVGEGYAKASDELLALIADVARLEGLVLDPVYTGKAFYGLLNEMACGRFHDVSDIVFVHTGGVFGLFPFASQLTAVLRDP